jgi:5'-3' exonuclease
MSTVSAQKYKKRGDTDVKGVEVDESDLMEDVSKSSDSLRMVLNLLHASPNNEKVVSVSRDSSSNPTPILSRVPSWGMELQQFDSTSTAANENDHAVVDNAEEEEEEEEEAPDLPEEMIKVIANQRMASPSTQEDVEFSAFVGLWSVAEEGEIERQPFVDTLNVALNSYLTLESVIPISSLGCRTIEEHHLRKTTRFRS